ncbi:MAG TPA: hypothetical protein VJP79_12765 [Nitrososphaera sp.]|nr:hypothetical protein [Nitrososphaera sp.]
MSKSRTLLFVVIGAAALVSLLAAGMSLDFQSGIGNGNATLAATPTRASGSLTIITLFDGKPADGAVYRVSPDPFTGSGNFTIQDGDVGRDSSRAAGIITIEGVSNGTFSVIQVALPDGRARDIIPRIVTISNDSSESVTFQVDQSDGAGQNASAGRDSGAIESITYAAKFECGTIRGDEGPLRPGHYDTDIGIFNKQDFPVRFTWSAAYNENDATNALLRTMEAQTSTSLVCKDIRSVLGGSDAFAEGFVLIEVPVDPRLLSSISGASSILSSTSSSQDTIDVLDVQTFYTANALDELPHSVLVDKISFVVTGNVAVGGGSSNMTSDLPVGKVLDVTLPSSIGELSNPESKVRAYLSEKYNLTQEQIASIEIEIKSVDVGVGTMIDDHAISLSRVAPRAKAG